MKIKHDFVTNSSSTSFCVYGVIIYKEDFEDRITQETNSNTEILELIEAELGEKAAVIIENETGLNVWHSSESEEFIIGISAENLKDDETPRILKNKVLDGLRKIGINLSYNEIGFHYGEIYD